MSINFDNKYLIDAPTTMQGDLSNLINNSTAVYMLAESEDNQETALIRKKLWNKLINKAKTHMELGMCMLGILVGIFLLIALIAFVMYCNYSDEDYLVPMFIFVLLTCVCSYFSSKLLKMKENQFVIEISNYNDECYQFRIMPDNKLYILVGANFDEKGESVATNSITELDPVCSDCIVMNSITSLVQYAEGAVIKGEAIVKSYRVRDGFRRYLQLEHPQQMTVFLQKGIYPEEMLDKIAHTYGMKF